MSSKYSSVVMKKILEWDPNASGSLTVEVKNGSAIVTGSVNAAIDDLGEKLSELLLAQPDVTSTRVHLTPARSLLVVEEVNGDRTSSLADEEKFTKDLDQISIIYQGELELHRIVKNPDYKRENWNTRRKIANCVSVLGFIAPIVLDRNLKIIDGNLRATVAEEENEAFKKNLPKNDKTTPLPWAKVPVVILDVEGTRADFLRLVLNRSSEFQRWYYGDNLAKDGETVINKGVDTYIDDTPQASPLLEPLGFFGERILPASFFGDTVIEYEIHDEFKSQQSFYKQEYGLAKWAELRREAIAKEEAEKQAPRKKKTEGVSLFDLMPQEEDFIPTYDPKEEMKKHIDVMRGEDAVSGVLGNLTDNYDDVMRAKKEAKGQAWQTARRSPKKVIADLKAEAANPKEEANE